MLLTRPRPVRKVADLLVAVLRHHQHLFGAVHADLLRERASTSSAQAGDRVQAVALYDESLQIATEIGMRPLMERVLSRKEILKA